MTDRSLKKGLGPGSLVYVGDKTDAPVKVQVIDYTHESIYEAAVENLATCHKYMESGSVTWIDVDGIHDARMIEQIGEAFNIHSLALEDIMNSEGRPKVEFYDNFMFVVLKMIDVHPQTKELNVEQFSLVVGAHWIVTFQERPGDSFDPIRESIRKAKGRVRGKDARFLAYLLLDVIVDNYIAVSEQYAKAIEMLEQNVLRRTQESQLKEILNLRNELIDFKRSIDPLKEAVNSIQREVPDEVSRYYRDLYDHIIHESENLAMYREMLVNLLDLYHSHLSHKMNAVMKVLTVITTIFVPLTFLVGVYGMNFDNMPELHWNSGYYAIWAIMLGIVIFQLFWFRRKRWI